MNTPRQLIYPLRRHFTSSARARYNPAASAIITTPPNTKAPSSSLAIKRLEAQSVARRALLERTSSSVLYPRVRSDPLSATLFSIREKYGYIEPGANLKDALVTLRGWC